jgi:peroxiredoxin
MNSLFDRAGRLPAGRILMLFALSLGSMLHAQSTESSVTGEIKSLSTVTAANRPAATLKILNEIHSFPDGMQKVWLAFGLTRLIGEDDVNQQVLRAIAQTFASALKDLPTKPDAPERGLLYMYLATFIHYQHVQFNVSDAELAKALAVLAANDADVARADFTLRDLQGREVTLSKLRGNVVLVTFWATWCVPCRQEMPDLDALYQRLHSKGLIVLSLTSDPPSKVGPVIQSAHYHPQVLLDTGAKIHDQFHVSEIPHSFLFDRNGKFVVDSIDAQTPSQLQAMVAQAGLRP